MTAPDSSSPITNPNLDQALKDLAEATTAEEHAEGRTALYTALMQSMLILPAPEALTGDGPLAPITEEDELQMVTFETDAGETLLIAFTNEDAALAWEPEGMPYLGLRGLDAVLIAAQNQITALALNPAGPHPYRLQQAEIQALAQGGAPQPPTPTTESLKAGTTVLISAPGETPPASWRAAVVEVLTHYPSIERAYFFQLHIPPEGERHVIGLVLYAGMSPAAQERMVKTMLDEFGSLMTADQSLDFVVLDDPSFLQTVQDTVPPIYEADE
jgi:hypothetical protein